MLTFCHFVLSVRFILSVFKYCCILVLCCDHVYDILVHVGKEVNKRTATGSYTKVT